jgi:multicomponent Na+:H+ antiporter subunit F
MKKRIQWARGTAVLLGVLYVILFKGLPVLFYQDLPFIAFFQRCFYVLLLASALCMVRVFFGPTAADRIVAIDILGILIVGFCAVLCIPTGRNWYMDIGIAWALQSFIATLALAKFLEGRDLDE